MKKSVFFKILAVMGLAGVLTLSSACSGGNKPADGAMYPPLVLEADGKVDAVKKNTAIPTEAVTVPPVTENPITEAPPTEVPTMAPPTFKFTGRAYAMADAVTGEIIWSYNQDRQLYIASITKLLTALTALDYLDLGDSVTVQDGWLDFLKTDEDIDAFGMKAGQTYTVRDVMKMLLIKSFGDAALTLQYATVEASGRDFIELMNEKAAALGMTGSHFDNPIGLDTGNGFTANYSNAEDCVKLMYAAYSNETVFDICSMRTTKLDCGKELKNTAAVFSDKYESDEYLLLGGKTGSTNASGSSFACVCSDTDTDSRYIIIYLNGTSSANMAKELAEMMKFLC